MLSTPGLPENESQPTFSIVTASLNMLKYLPRCCASVADQAGVRVEQIVVDAVSKDGSVEWLQRNSQITSISEKDDGMYDAINKGLRMARGHIFAYLNADEQYLPGTLKAVADYFAKNPWADVVYGDTLVIDVEGGLIAYRKATPLRWPYVMASCLYVFSASMFVRRRIIDEGVFFDTSLKAVADQEFVVRLLKRGYRFSRLPRYLSAFTITGSNKIRTPESERERLEFQQSAPRWVTTLQAPLNACRLAEKLLYGAYFEHSPLKYSIFVEGDLKHRREFCAYQPSPRFSW